MSQLIREDWWPTPVWYYDVPTSEVDPKLIEAECYALKDRSEGRVASNSGGWQSLGDKSCTNINNLLRYLAPIVMSAAKDYGVNEIHEDILEENYWVNINCPGSYNRSHTHAGSVLSGVFYVKCPENSGAFVLECDQFQDYFNANFLNNSNKLNFHTVGYEPVVNRLIIFPSWLKHRVDTNESKEDRVSIAFNV
jgi:uncharacterized protein (TIGR02466 family)